MTLYCPSIGEGPDIVLLHGWAWHGEVWRDVAQSLSRDFRVWTPDLPGHGRSGNGVLTLEDIARVVAESVPDAATWIGWSLGGLVALTAAQRRYASRLVLVAASARFVQDEQWQCALSRAWFEQFNHDLNADAQRTLERFASLHLASASSDRVLLRRLRSTLLQHGVPKASQLRAGLDLLSNSDLRSRLSDIDVPTLIVHGERDQIVPIASAENMVQSLPRARAAFVADAGHAPFLSHASWFVDTVGDFLRE